MTFAAAASCCLTAAACTRRPAADAAAGGAVVAQVGTVALREADLARAIAREPGAVPARYAAPAARRGLVDGLVRFELLAQAAEAEGLTRDPDAVHAMRQIAVTKFVNQHLGASADPASVSRADIARYYQEHRDRDYTRPAAARVRQILVADADAAQRLAAAARALSPGDDAGFAALARRDSADARTRDSGGDLGFVDPHSRQPPPIVAAALALAVPGDVAGPIKTDSGYHVLRLVERRAAAVSALGDVEEAIRQVVYRERRQRALDDLIAGLRAKTPVELSTDPPALVAAP